VLGSPRAPGIGAVVVLVVAIVLLVAEGDDEGAPGRADREQAGATTATVTRVVDGDTVEVSLGGESEDVRYIGVDTPETVAPGQPVECFGKPASHFNEHLVEGERVRLAFDDERRDRYGRLLAYVYLGPVFVNAELVRRGYARTLTIAPNTDRAGLLARLEHAAGNAGRGLWGAC
jgi:micrococcal nuclease